MQHLEIPMLRHRGHSQATTRAREEIVCMRVAVMSHSRIYTQFAGILFSDKEVLLKNLARQPTKATRNEILTIDEVKYQPTRKFDDTRGQKGLIKSFELRDIG